MHIYRDRDSFLRLILLEFRFWHICIRVELLCPLERQCICGFVKYMNFKELTSIVRRYRVVALFTGSPAAVRIAALTWARRLSVPVLAYRLQPLLGLEIQKSRNVNVTHFTLLVHVGTHTILRQYTCLSCDFLFSIFMLLHHCSTEGWFELT